MKSLHKKLSAMLLAGVVVIGGVVGSGVSSFAASAKSVDVKNSIQEKQVERVNYYCRYFNGKVLKSSYNEEEIDEFIKKEHSKNNRVQRRLLKDVYKVKYRNLPLCLNDMKRNKRDVAKVKVDDIYYLIQLR